MLYMLCYMLYLGSAHGDLLGANVEPMGTLPLLALMFDAILAPSQADVSALRALCKDTSLSVDVEGICS
jgi:hypothetical protein